MNEEVLKLMKKRPRKLIVAYQTILLKDLLYACLHVDHTKHSDSSIFVLQLFDEPDSKIMIFRVYSSYVSYINLRLSKEQKSLVWR